MNWDKLSMADRAAYIKLGLDNGITDLKIIRDAHNKYLEGGSIETSRILDVKDIMNNFTLNPDTLRERFYNYFDPYLSYSDNAINRAINLVVGGRDFAKRKFLEHKDAFGNSPLYLEGALSPFDDAVWGTYLTIPKDKRKYKTELSKSSYKPTKGSTKDAYYTIPINDEVKKSLVQEGLSKLKIGENKNTKTLFGYNMGTSTIGRGIDKNKGEYISYYDKWDINPLYGDYSNNSLSSTNSVLTKFIPNNGSDVFKGITNPISFYDRIYLNDYYGIKDLLKPNEYYGGYLPEINVFPY